LSDEVTLNVDVMTCASCVLRVEQGLKDLDGVRKASVNFATEKATVEYDSSVLGPESIADKVKDLGYEVVGLEKTGDAVQKTTISAGGMTCAACVRRVELALKAVDGVKDAAVNLTTARATVIHWPDWAGVEGLEQAVSDAGYEFLGVFGATLEDPVEAAQKRELKALKIKFSVGLVLSVVIFMGSMQYWFPYLRSVPRQIMLHCLFVLTTPVVFWVGSRFYVGAVKAAKQKTTDMNTLVAVGAMSAFLYSALATFFRHFFTTAWGFPLQPGSYIRSSGSF